MVIVLLYRVTFQASYKGSHFELGITTDMSMRNTIPEPTNQTKVSLARRWRNFNEYVLNVVIAKPVMLATSKLYVL